MGSASRLTPETIERLAAFVDRESLQSFRARTTTPWSWLPRILRVGAVTLGADVCFRPEVYSQTTARGLALIAHECVHVRDYRRMGPVRFLARYALGAIRSRFVHDRHPMELEANALQASVRSALPPTL